MATTITPTVPISTLADAVAFLTEVRNDKAQTATETEFLIEIMGKTYSVRMPWPFQNVRAIWDITVTDNGQWPDRTDATLGHQWEWEYAIDTIITDLTRFFPSPTVIDTGLYLHLDASVEDNVTLTTGTMDVEAWLDTSGNGFDATQDVDADKPLLVEADQNGLNVIAFDGVSDHLITAIESFKDWTLFVVGKYESSVVTDRGTFLAAMGKEGTFGGLDAYVLNSVTFGTEGTVQTYIDQQSGFQSTTGTLAASTYGLLEWAQVASKTLGTSDAGIDGAVESFLDCEDTSDDFFDTTRQPDVEPTPVTGAVGRTNAGINAGFDYNYLEGSIGEIVLYNRKLSDAERATVRAGLIAKWGI